MKFSLNNQSFEQGVKTVDRSLFEPILNCLEPGSAYDGTRKTVLHYIKNLQFY